MKEESKKTNKLEDKKTELVVKARFVRKPPDKIRFIGKLIIDKELNQAINTLEFSKSLARKPLLLVLKNAVSQLSDKNIDKTMYVKSVIVDEGPKLKRRRIISRGRATNILKRSSHISIVLSDNGNPPAARGIKFEARNPKQTSNIQNLKERK